MRFIVWTLLSLFLIVGSALAQPPPDKREPAKEADKPTKKTNGEVTCVDGSTTRIALKNDVVGIETKYGKLVIPAGDIERIEFAFRLPDDIAKKIDAALKRVASETFAERKAASKELLELGPRAYPAVKLATKSSDPELARQAELLVTEIRAKVPAGALKFPKFDRIQTAECAVTGRITSEVKLIPTP